MGKASEDLNAIAHARSEVDRLKWRTESILVELEERVRPPIETIKKVVTAPARVRAGISRHPGYFALACGSVLAAGVLLGMFRAKSRKSHKW